MFAGLVPIKPTPDAERRVAGRAAPLVVVSALAGVATLVLLHRRRYPAARIGAVVAVAAVVIGWGVAQYPWLLVDEVTIADAAGADATLVGLLVVVGLAASSSSRR